MSNLPWPGIKPVSPTLAGRFLTTGPPGKSQFEILFTFTPHHLSTRMVFPSLFLPLRCSVNDPEDGNRSSKKLVTTPEPLLGVCPFLGNRRKETTVQQKKNINQKLVIIQNSFFFLIEDGDPKGTSRNISFPASLSDKINSSCGWKGVRKHEGEAAYPWGTSLWHLCLKEELSFSLGGLDLTGHPCCGCFQLQLSLQWLLFSLEVF